MVMIFTHSRNAAMGNNSMYCMVPDPIPSTAFGKGSATPDYCQVVLKAEQTCLKACRGVETTSPVPEYAQLCVATAECFLPGQIEPKVPASTEGP